MTRKLMTEAHFVDKTLVFEDYKDLLKASAETNQTVGKRLADAVLVTVQDFMHEEVTIAFAEQGYHILCEKPMSTNLAACFRMEAAVKKAGIIFGMGHGQCLMHIPLEPWHLCSCIYILVLRYSPYTKALTEVIRSGTLGQLINIVHIEPVGFYHFAHSYVRGNWAREKDSAFSLMTKSCQYVNSSTPIYHLCDICHVYLTSF